MVHTNEEILEISKKIMKDFRKSRYKDSDIESIFFSKEKELYKGGIHPCWTIAIKAPFDNTDFLTISDETGEPLYYQNFNMIIYEIGMDSDGNYYRKEK